MQMQKQFSFTVLSTQTINVLSNSITICQSFMNWICLHSWGWRCWCEWWRWRNSRPRGRRFRRWRQIVGRCWGSGGNHSRWWSWSSSVASSSTGIHQLETELEEKLFRLSVPMCPKTIFRLVNFARWYLECNGLIWFSSEQKILPFSVWRFNFLFISRHESVSWHNSLCYFRIINFK